MFKRTMFVIKLLCAVVSVAQPAFAGEVSVAVAANFTDAARDLAPLFKKTTGHTARISFGSTGKLYAQIENGAPFELFLAADSKRPQKAEGAGLAVPGSRFTYAMGKLVLWSAKPAAWSDAESYLKRGSFAHLAIANPKTAPYGHTAEQVMQHLGIWNALQTTLVQGDSIAQTFQFVATGNAEAGFVAASQVKAWKGDAGSLWKIPQAMYAPIEQQALLLKKGENNPAAKAFLQFLQSEAARAVIIGYGYGVQ